MTTRRAKREKQTSDNISWPRNVIYSHFLAKKCYHVTFLGQEMLSASGVGDHISSSRNCDTDNGYNTKNCGSITHIQQHLTTNCTTSGMRALRPFGGCSRFAGPRGNNNRASVVVVEPGGTNRNETKNTGPMGVCGRANTSAMHSQCIAQPHIPDVQWGHWGHHPRVREARVGCNHKIPSTTIIGCGGEHRKQANNMVLVRAGNIAQVNVTVPTLFFFDIHCTSLHHGKGGNVHDRTLPTQMSLQVGYEDLACEIVHCTPLRWSHCAAGVTVPCTSLGGPILIKNDEPRICPKFPILILKLVHPIDRNEARLESMAPLLEILEVVDMTMIDDVNGDGGTMVFNTKKGGGGEGEEKGGVHPSTLVPGGEGVALQIGMPGPWRLAVEGVEGGGVLPMPPLHLLGLALPFAPASGHVPRDMNPRRAILHLPFPQIQTHPPIGPPTAFFNMLHDSAGIRIMELQHNSLQIRVVVKQRQQRVT